MHAHNPASSATPLAADNPETADLSRRGFIRGAVLFAIAANAGLSLTACGGGNGSDLTGPFIHGVASGDPLADRVMLWTRVTASAPGTLNVGWELAADANFGVVLATGNAATSAAQDYTVKVDATGLQPATTYFYRFRFGGEVSITGRTKTLPATGANPVKLAMFSCSNYPAGYFNVFADAARRGDIDVALHLGDVIYEYGLTGFASQIAFAFDREVDPRHETVTLDDYRRRHAQYRLDQDLRALNAAMPMIAVWDDHDVANNAWSGGAGGHDPSSEGGYVDRRNAAIQAWQEWMPIRVSDPANPLKIYRSFDFGSVASLHMLDTRLIGRDQQVGQAEFQGGAGREPGRQLLGAEQSAWLSARMQASGATWQVLGQQVLMARMELPQSLVNSFDKDSIQEYMDALNTPDASRTQRQKDLINQPSTPYNLDAWDGYPAARETVLSAARSLDKNLVSLAGDTHNAWASDLRDNGGAAVGVEFATASVTSPGFDLSDALIPRSMVASIFTATVPTLRYAETGRRGYVVVTLSSSEARADWVQISTVFSRDYNVSTVKSLKTLPGAANRVLVAV